MGFEAPMKMKKRKPCRRDRLETQEEFFSQPRSWGLDVAKCSALSTLMATSKPALRCQVFPNLRYHRQLSIQRASGGDFWIKWILILPHHHLPLSVKTIQLPGQLLLATRRIPSELDQYPKVPSCEVSWKVGLKDGLRCPMEHKARGEASRSVFFSPSFLKL